MKSNVVPLEAMRRVAHVLPVLASCAPGFEMLSESESDLEDGG